MDIDRSIAALTDALVKSGRPAPEPLADQAILDEIDRAVAPLTVPKDLRRLWETIDPWTVTFRADPDLSTPSESLETWRESLGLSTPETVPNALFPVGRDSHEVMSVELDDPRHGPGGGLFRWNLVGDEYTLEYLGVADWLDAMTAALSAGRDDLYPEDDRVQSEKAIIHDAYGFAPRFSRDDTREWPLHWQRSSALGWPSEGPTYDGGRMHVRPRRNATLAEILATPGDVSSSFTVRAHAVDFAVDRMWAQLVLADGTGELAVEIWLGLAAAVLDTGATYDFDLSIEAGGVRATPPLWAVEPKTSVDLTDPVTRALLNRFDEPSGAKVEAVFPVQ